MRFYFRINVEDQDGMHLLKIWFSFPEHSGGGAASSCCEFAFL